MITLAILAASVVTSFGQDPVSTVLGTKIPEKTVIVLEDDELVRSNWKSLYAVRQQGQRRFSSSVFKETIPFSEKRGLHRLKSGHWLYVPQSGHGIVVDYRRIDFTKVAILPILYKSNFSIPKPGVGRMGDLHPFYKDFLMFAFSQKFSHIAVPSGSALDDLPCMSTITSEVTFSSGGHKLTTKPSAQSPTRRTKEDRIKEDEVFKGRELQFKYPPAELGPITKAIFEDPSNPGGGIDFHAFKTKSLGETPEDSAEYCIDQLRNCMADTRLEANALSKGLIDKLKSQFPEVFGQYQIRKRLSEFPKEVQDRMLAGLKSETGGPASDEEKESFRNSATITSTRISLGIYLAVAPLGDYYGTDIWLN